jgi:beta-N-acetylglucosaminidase
VRFIEKCFDLIILISIVFIFYQSPVNAEGLPSRIWVETPKSNYKMENDLEIRGWALNASGVEQVNILIDGQVKGKATIGLSRPDVNKAYPGYPDGENSGFKYKLDINTLKPGEHTIKVEAIGKDTTSIYQNIKIIVIKKEPKIWVETPKSNYKMENDLEIRGWALNASGVEQVNILIDGQVKGKATIGLSRPDVNKAYPGYPDGDKSGYSYILKFDSISIGPHKLTVQAIGNNGTKIEQSVNFQKGNAYVTYTNYTITFDDFVNKQIGNTPALQVKNANGIYEWRYAKIQNGQQGYYIQTNNGQVWYYDEAQYNAIKQEIINKADPITLSKDDTQIYQFVKLSYVDGISASDLNDIFNRNGVLNGKGQVFIDAAKAYNVNPVYLAAHAIHETGNGTSDLAKGIIVNGVKVYNLFGIGAVDSNPNGGGAQTAYNNGWDTIDKAIYGGAKWISNGYINAGQDTLYKMRWNPSNPTVHQYATDVKWAYNQAFKYKEIFDLVPNIKLVFEIPKFK